MSQSESKTFLEELKEQAKSNEFQEQDVERRTYVDPQDGTVYEWDAERKGWFPKVRKWTSISILSQSRGTTRSTLL